MLDLRVLMFSYCDCQVIKATICWGVLVMAFFAAVSARAADPVIDIDGSSEGRTFEGLGALVPVLRRGC